MWLINTEDYSLREVHDIGEDHPYAILSHTWEESEDTLLQREVTFQDMQYLDEAKRKTGWVKIERTCQLAKNYEPSLKWAWIDTCCINKSSSAELTEAINSMFYWYHEAKVCFVHLSDLRQSPTSDLASRRSRDDLDNRLRQCYWFTRGWTLQELVAPRNVEFYDESWTKRGTKDSLKATIREITNIDYAVLDDCEALSTVPVGRRMSWAATRSTKRVEDIAYSLFGIFDVNMPLIYGEGHKAFLRLQSAIAQQNNDLSMFAWTTIAQENNNNRVQRYHGMFAQSHRYFKNCNHLVSVQDPFIIERYSFAVTNQGLEFQAALKEDPDGVGYLMNLYCQNEQIELSGGQPGILALRLVKTLKGYARRRADGLVVATNVHTTHIWPGALNSIQVPIYISSTESIRLEQRFQNAFRFRVQCPDRISVSLAAALDLLKVPDCTPLWDSVTNTLLTGGYPLFTGLLSLKISSCDTNYEWPTVKIICGFNNTSNGEDVPHQGVRPPLQPWAGLISPNDQCYETTSNEAADKIFGTLEDLIRDEQNYGPAMSSLSQHISSACQNGSRLPQSAILTHYRYLGGGERDTKLDERSEIRLSIAQVIESGVLLHEVTVHLRPVSLLRRNSLRKRTS